MMLKSVSAEQRLVEIAAIYATPSKTDEGFVIDNHVGYNLDAVLYDLERTGVDGVCLQTLRNIQQQLLAIEKILKPELDARYDYLKEKTRQ